MLREKKHGKLLFVLSTFSLLFGISDAGNPLSPDEVYTQLKSNFEFEMKRLRVKFNTELNKQKLAIENRLEDTKKEISEAIENRLEDSKKDLAKSEEFVRQNCNGHTGQILNSADLSRLTKHLVIMNKALVNEKQYLRDTEGRLEERLIKVEQNILNVGEGHVLKRLNDDQGKPYVYFHVSLPTDQLLPQSRVIEFSRVFSNQGDGYDNTTGIFTAPYSGVYLFFFSVRVGIGKYDSAYVRLYVDGVFRAYAIEEAAFNAHVTHMYAGDTAWIQTGNIVGGSTHNMRLSGTTFTGIMLY